MLHHQLSFKNAAFTVAVMTEILRQSIKQSPSRESHARHPSFAGSQDGSISSPVHSRKRSADQMKSEDGSTSRKGRACLACRKLKVKCDSLERGDSGCSRCQRLRIECITTRRLRVSLEDAEGYVDLIQRRAKIALGPIYSSH